MVIMESVCKNASSSDRRGATGLLFIALVAVSHMNMQRNLLESRNWNATCDFSSGKLPAGFLSSVAGRNALDITGTRLGKNGNDLATSS